MIVIAIIGVLASLAVAAYQTYTVRAQVAEGLNLIAGAKSPIIDAFNNSGTPPADRSAAGMSPLPADTQGNYVSAMNIVNGRVDVTFGNRAHQDIQGATLSVTPYMTPGNTYIWRCGYAPAPGGGAVELTGGGVTAAHIAPTVDARYVPSTCRN